MWDVQDPSGAKATMVSVDHVAHKILSYVPYVLVLIDLRYEGKEAQHFYFDLMLLGKLVNGSIVISFAQ